METLNFNNTGFYMAPQGHTCVFMHFYENLVMPINVDS